LFVLLSSEKNFAGTSETEAQCTWTKKVENAKFPWLGNEALALLGTVYKIFFLTTLT